MTSLSFSGYDIERLLSCIEAGDGRQGLEIIGRELPDLIVSDVMMPEMDGIELLAAVKVNRDTSHIPVILLSAKASVDDRVRGWSMVRMTI